MNTESTNSYWSLRNLGRKAWFWVALSVIGLIAYHQDAIRGQWKFERLCKEEAGARVYGKIEKGQGWTTEDRSTTGYSGPFIFGEIGFVRYTNAKGETFDVMKKEGTTVEDYVFSPVNESRLVRYKFVRNSTKFSDDDRFSSVAESIIDFQTGAVLATFTSFGFSWTKPERTLFASPTGQTCEMLGYENVNVRKFINAVFEQGR